jgi:NAD/NADP transhydrogenase beta subunit
MAFLLAVGITIGTITFTGSVIACLKIDNHIKVWCILYVQHILV